MRLVNLTPHPVAIYRDRAAGDGPEEVIPPSGTVARVATVELGKDDDGYPVVEYGHAEGLPGQESGVRCIVSLVLALAVRAERDDLYAPYGEVRNEQGTMIGCRTLQRVF